MRANEFGAAITNMQSRNLRRTQPLERQIQAGVLELLRMMPEVSWAFKQFVGEAVIVRPLNGASVRKQLQPAINLGMIKASQIGFIQGAPEGTLDIALGLNGIPVHCELEVKKPAEKPTQAQKDRIDLIRSSGGLAGWVDDIERAQRLIKVWAGGMEI